MANRESLQKVLNANYDLTFFRQNVLEPVFGSSLTIYSVPKHEPINPSEEKAVKNIKQYGEVKLTDYRQLYLYEVALAENVIVERNKVSIGAVIKRMIAGNNAVLVNFHYPHQAGKSWRLSFIAKDQVIDDGEIKKTETHPKRYSYVLGPHESCRTAADRFAKLSLETDFTAGKLKEAFSVEKLSEKFFEDYKYIHYSGLIQYITGERIVRKDKKDIFERVQAPSNLFKVIFSKGKSEDDAKKDVRDFVKKLLGRIVFLSFVQKKGWLGASDEQWADGNANFLQNLFMASGQNDNFYYLWLRKLFFDTLNNPNRSANGFKLPDNKTVKIPYLNGGLFEDDDPKGILTFPPKLFADLFEFFNQYNFTIYEDSPDDHTVAVDPEMLGHIFENLLEDNKDKGAFYTPKEIVHYMCQESLIEYLCTKLNMQNTSTTTREDVERLIKHKEVSENIIQRAKEINRYLDELKICDPAIGSGAFPMGLLHEIFDAKQLLHQYCQGEGVFKAAEVKQNIIQNSIYGVDIEKGAVDIARLRFWLSLIVDEDLPRPLPNLDYKIVAGDSLLPKFEGEVVDIDWDTKSIGGSEAQVVLDSIQKGLEEIVKKQKQYFDALEKDKMSLKAEIRNLKIDLLINQLALDKIKYSSKNVINQDMFEKPKKDKVKELEILLRLKGFESTIKKLEQLKKQPEKPLHFFDWKLDFPEIMNPAIAGGNAGFDIVIANPPYVSFGLRGTGKVTAQERATYNNKYSNSAEYKISYYAMFMELGISIGNKISFITYIVPDSFLLGMYFSKIRKYILAESLVKNIDLLTYKVFGNATVGFSVIFLLNKNSSPIKYCDVNCSLIKSHKEFVNNKYSRGIVNSEMYHTISRNRFRLFFDDITGKMIKKMESDSVNLGKYFEGRSGLIAKGGQESLVAKEKISTTHYKGIISSSQVTRYWVKWDGSWINIKPSLIKSGYTDPNKIINPKILMNQTGDHLTCAIDLNGYYSLNNTHIFTAIGNELSIEYVCAILNSSLMDYYYKKTSLEESRAMAQIDIETAELLPVKLISKGSQEKFISTVQEISNLKQKNKNTEHLENGIDLMVYKLYDLAYDEVLVVDKDFEKQMSRVEYEKLDYGV